MVRESENELLIKLKEKGEKRFSNLINKNGGFIEIDWLKEKFDFSEEDIKTLIEEDEILFIKKDEKILFPAFQFIDDGRYILPEIRSLLEAEERPNHMEIIRFLLVQSYPPKDRETPLDKISKEKISIKELQQNYLTRFEMGK